MACLQIYTGKVSKERGKEHATKHISFAPDPGSLGKPIPAVYGGAPARSQRKPPPHVMDYTVKAGVRPSSQVGSTPTVASSVTYQMPFDCICRPFLTCRQHIHGGAFRDVTALTALACLLTIDAATRHVLLTHISCPITITCGAGVLTISYTTAVQADYSTRGGSQFAGGMTSQVASALAAARVADRSVHGAGDASIRYGRAHFAPSQEGFAQQFGPYAGAWPS